jgi:hypothetical protein
MKGFVDRKAPVLLNLAVFVKDLDLLKVREVENDLL